MKSLNHRKCGSRYRVRVIGFPQNQSIIALYGYRVLRSLTVTEFALKWKIHFQIIDEDTHVKVVHVSGVK